MLHNLLVHVSQLSYQYVQWAELLKVTFIRRHSQGYYSVLVLAMLARVYIHGTIVTVQWYHTNCNSWWSNYRMKRPLHLAVI